ncbi:MAG: response regulator [Chloroflexi bacterium]|nr:response regulator [Chloroflexota bacterium]
MSQPITPATSLPPAPNNAPIEVPQSERASATPEAAGRDSCVLVVDDNVMNRNLLEAQLAQMGIEQIKLAAGGKQAVEAVQRDPQRYQLIFMDCDMPGIDGYEATRQIRAFEASSTVHVPIIALTAGGSGHERERCIEAGMDDYLSKPVSFKDLKVKVEHWL